MNTMNIEPENKIQENEEQGEQPQCNRGGHHHWGHHEHHMMRFAMISLEEEVDILEEAKVRLEERLAIVNTRLQKLKA